jgi:tetratricopeptide (TPR) repeat protein
MRATVSLPIAVCVAAAFVAAATLRDAREHRGGIDAPPVSREPPSPAQGTSRAQLAKTLADMKARLAASPTDAAAVVYLSDASLRLQRVNSDGRVVNDAESQLRDVLKRVPAHYEARRMLAAVLLSQHRYGAAVAEANRLRASDPNDAWNYGAIGDGYMELGAYEQAFEAFDRMGQLKPGAPAYARVSYALEIKGDLDGAIEYMQRAVDGTTPNDAESLAWHLAQLGDLHLQLGRLPQARMHFERAAATFPGHPFAVSGLARVKVIDGDLASARLMLQGELAKTPRSDVAVMVGDLSAELGDHDGAEAYYRMAEQIERAALASGSGEPQLLSRFFSEHDRQIPEAVTLAEAAVRSRGDIVTMDTAAFAYLKAGQIDKARQAAQEALRTGTRDARILWHAAEIASAAGDHAAAAEMLARIPSPQTIADLRVRAGVEALERRSKADQRRRPVR